MKKLPFVLVPLALLAGALLAQTTTPTPPPSALTVGTGFDYSRGSYGLATDTTVTSVPVEFSYEGGPWIFRAFTSWLTIKGPSAAALTGGAGNLTRPTSASESGVGDVYLDLTYRPDAISDGWHLDPTVRVKLPTADEDRGLGTGEADYYAQLTGYRTFGSVTPFVTGGYRILGDSDRYQLRDGAYGSGGAHFRTSDRTVLTASLDWRSRVVDGGDAGTEATVAVTHDLNDRWRLFVYGQKGFTDASPDVGGGMRLSYRF
ncbi:MAG: hypothetical protein HYV96_20670 [Opitutae bacterium]|nr:hypothetical protein [Opitutae bacterium]